MSRSCVSSLSLWSSLCALALTACASSHAPPPKPAAASAPEAPTLTWRPWGQAAFDEAKRTHKLVFVDAGIEGCTACRWMHDLTLADPSVIARLDESFVTVSVDADQQPDLGARFEDWAWPALLFFDDSGVMIRAIRGNKLPQSFLPILADVAAHPTPLAAHAPEPASDAACTDVLDALDRRLGTPTPGGPMHVQGAPTVVDLARGGPAQRARALITVEDTLDLVDPVWGGVFVGSFPSPRGATPVPEKRTEHEAYALELLSAAYAADHDERTRHGIDDVVRYLRDTMRGADGTFFSTQRDQPSALPSTLTAGDYYRLDDAGRRKYGVPAVDHGSNTDQNARAIIALAHAADATGDASILALASHAADAILAARVHPEGWVAQRSRSPLVTTDPRLRPVLDDDREYLRAQAAFGLALVTLYSSTGDAGYLTAARAIEGALAPLADEHGGFFDTVARDTDALGGRSKAAVDNVTAARFLFALSESLHDDALHERGARTLAAIAPRVFGETDETLAAYALALFEREHGVVDVSIASDDASGPAARALLTAGRAAASATKLVRVDVDGRYPKKGDAAAYVCDRSACSPPITDPVHLATEIARASALSCAR